jgi:hypothetical protein
MYQNAEIILEGSYLYYQEETHYADENFKLVKSFGSQNYTFYSEILSRLKTGEFLKILVKYEMNQYFLPISVRIERSVGDQYSLENFQIDTSAMEMNYSFESSGKKQEFKKNISPKHYLTSPAFCTLGVFTLSKRIETAGRTSVLLIASENEWYYTTHPSDKIIYADYKTGDVQEININGNLLNASVLKLYQYDSTFINTSTDSPVEIHLSKHFGVPYQLIHGGQKIIIKFLRKSDT